MRSADHGGPEHLLCLALEHRLLALALLRCERWAREGPFLSARDSDVVNVPQAFADQLTETLYDAA